VTRSIIVELVVADGAYERLSTQYQNAKVRKDAKEVCPHKENWSEPRPDTIRDGAGKSKANLVIENVSLVYQDDGTLHAWGKYTKKLGFQLKVFAEVEKEPTGDGTPEPQRKVRSFLRPHCRWRQ
jgi:hypothetical protein